MSASVGILERKEIMLYEEARVYLDQASKYGSVLGLESISALLDELDHPEDKLKFVHIAGTNGKGSILAFLAAILQAEGYKVGRYISPTVIDYLERFQINESYMSEETFAEIMEEVKVAVDRMLEKGHTSPTVFEIETAVAFLFFVKEKCDYVLLETGLGGRLDATNVVKNTLVSVFASISMDHMDVLGTTLEEIATEKAGIIKPWACTVSAPQEEVVEKVLMAAALNRMKMVDVSEIHILKMNLEEQIFSYHEFEGMKIHLIGKHQIENAATALEAVVALRVQGTQISPEAVKKGLAQAKWPGRFQVLNSDPLIIADGAHNENAAKRLAENMETYLHGKKLVAVMGVFKDKEYRKMIQIMKPYLDYVYTINLPNRERTLEKEYLVKELMEQGIPAEAAASVEEALALAKEKVEKEQGILVFGSLSYLGEVIRLEGRIER